MTTTILPKKTKENNVMAHPPSNVSVEDSLSKELLKLSFSERNATEEEIHGVGGSFLALDLQEETTELLVQSLLEFDKEIMTIKYKRKYKQKQNDDSGDDVLRNVESISSSLDETTIIKITSSTTSATTKTPPTLCYVNDPNVRLRFLRCDLFNTKKAVKRFINFLEFTKEIFGDFVAERPIQVSDFCSKKGELRALKNSRMQYLPFRDRSGRRILTCVQQAGYESDTILRYKILMYLDWIASEDIETQQRGVVTVAWPSDNTESIIASNRNSNSSSNSSSDNGNGNGKTDGSNETDPTSWERSLRQKITKHDVLYQQLAFDALPLRNIGIHFCAQDKPVYRILGSIYYFGLDSHHRSRIKFHFGESIEIRYKLQSYGIPVEILPLTHTGTVKLSYHSKLVAFRHIWETVKQEERQRDLLLLLLQQQQNYNYNVPTPSAAAAAAAASITTIAEDENNYNSNNTNIKKSEKKKVKLSMNVYENYVECPRATDVMFRKGSSYSNNPGNDNFRSLIEGTHVEHSLLKRRDDKVEMTWRIFAMIEEQNGGCGRFLDWDKTHNVWYHQKDRNVIREKIAHTYKEYNRNHSGRHTEQKQQINLSSNNDNYNNDRRRKEQSGLIVSKRRKIAITTARTAMGGKSCFCIGGGGGGSEYDSFESLFSDL
jgi:hypothetical protein